MLNRKVSVIAVVALLAFASIGHTADADPSRIVIVIHGGAGTILKDNMSAEREAQYRASLSEVLSAGYEILNNGGTSLDAVEACIRLMEDSPLFNAGRGAVFTNEGRNEMDASIMDGRDLNAGAVASVTNIKNPISAARKVMTETKHVLLVGEGAMKFAREQGLEFADSAYFFTQHRWDQLLKVREAEEKKPSSKPSKLHDHKGTAGAVARDMYGNLAAGTSTGGLTNKRFGRVGDSPIIGAGTYADNKSCAVSATGVGEYFIRGALSYEVCALMKHRSMSLEEAAGYVIHTELTGMAGADTGGLIALDKDGNFAVPFNTPGMYRGYIRADGVPHALLFKDEGDEN